MMMRFSIGTVSHGTLRTEDLLDSFANEIDYQVSHGRAIDAEHGDKLRALAEEARAVVDFDSDEASDLVDKLCDALNELAPPYVNFGTTEGDGADFGFWPMVDSLEEDARDGIVLKVNDLADVPEDYVGDLMLVSDHGNVTYGYICETDREFHEVWACV